jgi:RimJ/RimL family protein N-acetyltransferase
LKNAPQLMPIIRTERLEMIPFQESDTDFVIELLNSESWLKYIGDRNVRTTEDALSYLLKGPMLVYPEQGFGMYKVLLNDSLVPVGMCGLLKRKELPFPDIGFAFLPDYEGKGYAYEAASATLSMASTQLEISTVLAITVHYNIRSRNLLEKLGLHFQKTFRMSGDDEELMLYSNALGETPILEEM